MPAANRALYVGAAAKRMTLLGSVLPMLLAALLAACSSAPPVPSLPPLGSALERSALWTTSVSGSKLAVALVPARLGDASYAASVDGTVVQLNASNGGEVWRKSFDVTFSGGVGVGPDMIALGTLGGEVLALKPDGTLLWRVRVTSEVMGPPLIREDFVVVRTADARIVGLDLTSGERRWNFQHTPPPLVLRGYSALTSRGPSIFAGLSGGKLTAINAVNGVPRWETPVSTPRGTTEIERISDVTGAPWVGDDRVCAATYQGRIGCFNLDNGNLLWNRELSSATGMTGDARNVYSTDAKSVVVALARADGAPAWKQAAFEGRRLSTPAAAGNEVVVCDLEGYVHFLDRDTGAVIARGSTGGYPVDVPPLPIPGGVLIQTRDGTLAAFSIAR